MPKQTLKFKASFPFFYWAYDTGLCKDPRTEAQQQRDYAHEERLFSSAADPFGYKRILSSPYPQENQLGVGSCVPHGVGLALAIECVLDGIRGYTRLAWLFVYRLRANYPSAGCWLQNVFDLYKKRGAPLFSTLPDIVAPTESEANALVLTEQMSVEAEIYRGGEYYILKDTFNDIETLAGIASAGHGVPILIAATYEEWAQVTPKILSPNLNLDTAPVRHCISILPESGHIGPDGKRYVTIQDSALFGNIGLRHLREDFVKARVFGAGYWDGTQVLGSGPKPKHVFTMVLKYGSRDKEVIALQKLLISEGLLPNDCATGVFLGRTLAAVHAFQNKYADKILAPLNLDAPTDTWGSMCIAQANFLCR